MSRNNTIISVKADLNHEGKGKLHTHTTKGIAEEIEGDSPFDAGSLIRVAADGAIAPGFVGSSKAMAESNRLGFDPAAESFIFRLPEKAITFWIDGQTGGVYYINQVAGKPSGI